MVLRMHCPSCQQLMGYTEAQAGRRINCPRCKKGVVTPPAPQPQIPQAGAFDFGTASSGPAPFDLGEEVIVASPWRGVRAGIGWVRLGVVFLFLTIFAIAAFQVYVLRFVTNRNLVLMSEWIMQVAYRNASSTDDSSGNKTSGDEFSDALIKIAGVTPFVGVVGVLFSALFVLVGLLRCLQGPSSFLVKLLPLGSLLFFLLSLLVIVSLPFVLAFTTPQLDNLQLNMADWQKTLRPYLLSCKAMLMFSYLFGLFALGCFLLLVRSVCRCGPSPRLAPWVLPFFIMLVLGTVTLILADLITDWLAALQEGILDQLIWRSYSNQVLFVTWFVVSLVLLGWFVIMTVKAQRFLSTIGGMAAVGAWVRITWSTSGWHAQSPRRAW